MDSNRPTAPQLVFIGSPTQDVVLRDGTAHQVIGGAAYISALAARWANASVGIVARVPSQLPAMATGVFGPGGLFREGLSPHEGSLPAFRISYHAEDQASYSGIAPGLEQGLCSADIPSHWLGDTTRWIHIASIGFSTKKQLSMLKDITEMAPDWRGTRSAGTTEAMIAEDKAACLQLLMAVDVFFLNHREFALLCPEGLPKNCNTTVVVTHGPNGVTVHGGPNSGSHPAIAVNVVDPTGAGDAFCGGYIGASVAGETSAVQAGLQAAAIVLGGLGSSPLSHWVQAQVGVRANDSGEATGSLAPIIKATAQSAAFDFSGPPHLPVGHPQALTMLCISTLHQFGFWADDPSTGWMGPMYGVIDGKRYKGSDFIWAAFARAAKEDPKQLTPERMSMDSGLFERICTADNGRCPVPQLELHASLHAAHANMMMRHWKNGYKAMLSHANAQPKPIAALLESLKKLPGYMADPLAKKANLLAIILAARPEGFLEPRDPESIVPIVDYHMMRLCLRTGLVTIKDPELRRRIIARQWVDNTEELAIRQATGRAILALARQTNLSIAAIDGLFFQLGRQVCLETEPARCTDCPLTKDCAKDTALFQPVFRTSAY
jgi:hypothetical protein